MNLEEYIKKLLGENEADFNMEIEPAFRFELPFPNEEAEADA